MKTRVIKSFQGDKKEYHDQGQALQVKWCHWIFQKDHRIVSLSLYRRFSSDLYILFVGRIHKLSNIDIITSGAPDERPCKGIYTLACSCRAIEIWVFVVVGKPPRWLEFAHPWPATDVSPIAIYLMGTASGRLLLMLTLRVWPASWPAADTLLPLIVSKVTRKNMQQALPSPW